MKKEMKLPKPIETYIRAINARDADAFQSSFAHDAVVKDVGREIRGIAAIKEWTNHEIFAVNVTLDVMEVVERDGQTIVTVKIDGTFDRTGLPDPLLMDHCFYNRWRQDRCFDLSVDWRRANGLAGRRAALLNSDQGSWFAAGAPFESVRSANKMTTKEKYMGKLEGKIALITGGNSGIGLATAKQFVNEGAYVFITGRRDPELAAAVKEIGRNVTGVQGDVSNLGELDRLFAQIKREKGKLDIVFANAGVAKYAPFGKITEQFYDSIFNINVKGLIFTVQKVLPLLPEGASIILNASVVASKGLLANSVYSATKAAVRSFARTWTTDLKDRRIRVNAVSPGSISERGLASRRYPKITASSTAENSHSFNSSNEEPRQSCHYSSPYSGATPPRNLTPPKS